MSIKVKEDNYFCVQGWMVTELGLKGNALMLYAIIYGFSQTANTAFTGSVDYLCEWLGGVSRPTVINTLDNLVEKGLLTKSSTTKGAIIYNSYTAIRTSKNSLLAEDETSKKILLDTNKKTLLNNTENENIEKSFPKGKEEQAPKDTQKKSYKEVFNAPENKYIKDALVKFVGVCKGRNIKFQFRTLERWASILRDNAGSDTALAMAMVDQSIEQGWKDIYPLKKSGKNAYVKKEAVSIPVDTGKLATNPDGSYVRF